MSPDSILPLVLVYFRGSARLACTISKALQAGFVLDKWQVARGALGVGSISLGAWVFLSLMVRSQAVVWLTLLSLVHVVVQEVGMAGPIFRRLAANPPDESKGLPLEYMALYWTAVIHWAMVTLAVLLWGGLTAGGLVVFSDYTDGLLSSTMVLSLILLFLASRAFGYYTVTKPDQGMVEPQTEGATSPTGG